MGLKLFDWVTGMGTLAPQDWAWDELAAFLSVRRLQPVNLLLSTYWTMGAVRHGEYVAKVRVAPRKESAEKVVHRLLDPMSAPDIYRPALVAELQERPYEFDLQVQLCVDLEKMPVEERKCDHWVGDAASLGSGAAKASALRTGSAGLPRSCCRQSRQAGGTQLDQPLSPALPSWPARRGSQAWAAC